MFLLYHAYVYLEFLILACTIYILAPIEDSIQKAQVLTTAANVKLGEIQAIDYSWGEIDFVTKPLNEMRLMECTECEMSAPGAYDIDIEADDINVTDTATVIWEIA